MSLEILTLAPTLLRIVSATCYSGKDPHIDPQSLDIYTSTSLVLEEMATPANIPTNASLSKQDSNESPDIKPEFATQKSLMNPEQFFKYSQLSRTDTSLSQTSQKSLVPLYEDFEPQMPALALHSNVASNTDNASVAEGSCGSACDCTISKMSSRGSSDGGDASPHSVFTKSAINTPTEEFENHPDWMSDSDIVELDDENYSNDNM